MSELKRGRFEPYRPKVARWNPPDGTLLHSDVGGLFVSIGDYVKLDERIATLTLSNAGWQSQFESLGEKYEKLEAEHDALKAKLERMSAPISDGEALRYGYIDFHNTLEPTVIQVRSVNALLSARAQEAAVEKK